MNIDRHSTNPPQQATREAAAWLARHRRAPLSDTDALAFRAWLEASPDNVRAWNSQQHLWNCLQDVRDAPAILALREQAHVRLRKHRMHRLAWQFGAGLAATLIVGLFVWHSPRVLPESRIIRAAASSAMLEHTGQRALPQVTDVSTRIGERALVRLADSSTVTLNTDSAIHVDFSGARRSITLLRGEAYFEVATDQARPFVVAAGPRQVVAVGTAFAVKLRQLEVQVNLVEGRVRVEPLTNPDAAVSVSDAVMLEAGMSLLASANGENRVAALNIERETSWRSGKLVFPGDRLADVVAEMNRYSTQKIELRDASLGEQLLSGVFDPAGGAELARALEGYGMVRIVSQDEAKIILDAPDAARKKTDGR